MFQKNAIIFPKKVLQVSIVNCNTVLLKNITVTRDESPLQRLDLTSHCLMTLHLLNIQCSTEIKCTPAHDEPPPLSQVENIYIFFSCQYVGSHLDRPYFFYWTENKTFSTFQCPYVFLALMETKSLNVFSGFEPLFLQLPPDGYCPVVDTSAGFISGLSAALCLDGQQI